VMLRYSGKLLDTEKHMEGDCEVHDLKTEVHRFIVAYLKKAFHSILAQLEGCVT
jgi:hypothetical protein